MTVLSSERLWREEGGYYTERSQDLIAHPILPDLRRLRDRRMAEVFERHGGLTPGSSVIELGCGCSSWLPYLAREGYSVSGIDVEQYPAELAMANLQGAGVQGRIYCRDAFDLKQNHDLLGKFDLLYSNGVMEHFDDATERLATAGEYLKAGGRILTMVPNLRGVNWLLQRIASLDRLHMHVIYDSEKLVRVHEAAGFESVASGYVGFFDGYLSADETTTVPIRHRIHDRLCWIFNMGAEAWTRLLPEIAAPELSWFAPLVYYVGKRS